MCVALERRTFRTTRRKRTNITKKKKNEFCFVKCLADGKATSGYCLAIRACLAGGQGAHCEIVLFHFCFVFVSSETLTQSRFRLSTQVPLSQQRRPETQSQEEGRKEEEATKKSKYLKFNIKNNY